MTDQPSPQDAARLLEHLRRHQHRRATAGSGLDPDLARLRAWQVQRLARTHADLLASRRYGPACRFFLDDVYAPRDFSGRDQDLVEMHAIMLKFLPARLLRPLALALELNALNDDLDRALLAALGHEPGQAQAITPAAYAEACRRAGDYADRARQIDLIVEIGRGIDRLVRLPLGAFQFRGEFMELLAKWALESRL
ncbi:MAG: hypothetical protein ACE5H9_03925 [Anaerolineae bacterium]